MAGERFIDVLVEGAPDCAECCLRFKLAEAVGGVARVRWSDDAGHDGWWRVFGRALGGAWVPARAAAVEDSSAGLAMLVWGDAWGLWLLPEGHGTDVKGHAEPYLLLAPDAVERG
jgi:hypothetical protein